MTDKYNLSTVKKGAFYQNYFKGNKRRVKLIETVVIFYGIWMILFELLLLLLCILFFSLCYWWNQSGGSDFSDNRDGTFCFQYQGWVLYDHWRWLDFQQDFSSNGYYQFVPIRDTDIGDVIKYCWLRMEGNVKYAALPADHWKLYYLYILKDFGWAWAWS